MNSPFDEARYRGLLEGLDAVEIPLSHVFSEDTGYRCDSEFFRKEILLALQQVESNPHEILGTLLPRIQHPIEVERIYTESGARILLAQEVRSNELSLGQGSFMVSAITANKLEIGDVVLTRSGANFGQCAPVKTEQILFACADLLILRKGNLPSGFLSTFLNTRQGRLLLDRGSYGMAQPHIAPSYVRTIPVPIFESLLKSVDTLIEQAEKEKHEATKALLRAEQTLLRALGLENWQPQEPLSYSLSSRDAFAAGRLDAEYFAPRVAELLKHLNLEGLTIGGVAPARHDRFVPNITGSFDYIEISGLKSDGTVVSEPVRMADAPSRATWHVKNGDVITSMVRPIRRLSALVAPEQDGHVCSSGFVVLQPVAVPAEVLLTYLRLPQVCELMDLHTSASLYPAISEQDLLAIPISKIDSATQAKIVEKVRTAQSNRRRSTKLLDAAKRAVEIAIEQDEDTALNFIQSFEVSSDA